jgi:pimeloyl-ACP methyl ester carboxylesterase
MDCFPPYDYRVQSIFSNPGFTWIFLPGGPGLGSAYLEPLCRSLRLPGTTLLVDFPKDGTNPKGVLDFALWKQGLVDLLRHYEQPILVTHSFSGMFVLDTPELEPFLRGLVLMNTTTSNTFSSHMALMRQQHQLPDLIPAAAQYHLSPSVLTYKAFWEPYKQYCFTKDELALGDKLLPLFAYNVISYQYAIEHFYIAYQCRWIPSIPTLTLASELDYICPPTIFTANQDFKKNHILNTIIEEAGHFPWLKQIQPTQQAFNQFIDLLLT